MCVAPADNLSMPAAKYMSVDCATAAAAVNEFKRRGKNWFYFNEVYVSM